MTVQWTYGDAANTTVTMADANGVVYSVSINDPAVQTWIKDGNTPNPYVAPTQPALTTVQQAQKTYGSAIVTGITLTWSATTTLNGTYGIDPSARNNIVAEIDSILLNSSFTNGQQSRGWLDSSNIPHSFSIAQFKIFATTIAAYVDQLFAALQTASAGLATTWPSATVAVTG